MIAGIIVISFAIATILYSAYRLGVDIKEHRRLLEMRAQHKAREERGL
jgi:hypothetical protein